MRQVFDMMDFAVGSAAVLEGMPALPAMRAFVERIIAFLNTLSGKLLKIPNAKRFPDVIAFAFWCRKVNLLKLKEQYDDLDRRLGRGVAFHIAPSNVPVNFAYSTVVGMLAGNANIVRLPSKKFEQTEIICDTVRGIQQPEIASRLCLVRYAHRQEITDSLSSICASRVIWGGDSTIARVRESPLPPRANEIAFADRFSICLVNADKYIAEYDPQKTAREFYNDTYLTDQNACTSPRIIVWFGRERDKAKKIFWDALSERLSGYEPQPMQTINKLSALYRFAASADCKLLKADDCKIMRVTVNQLDNNVLNNLESSGYFYEYNAESLDEILPVCTRKCQTLSYIGFDSAELQAFILSNAPSGIDRIVSAGKTMNFALVWDGVDLIRTLSRQIASETLGLCPKPRRGTSSPDPFI
ncbi:MAG: hypothetical protein LBE65_00745 [Synergistaceae bacterium]|jgi:hypothetical protein|nr:hypothetical protein [Synergistaceae bacterium]